MMNCCSGWEKIDVDLLDTKQSEFNGRTYPSRKEKIL